MVWATFAATLKRCDMKERWKERREEQRANRRKKAAPDDGNDDIDDDGGGCDIFDYVLISRLSAVVGPLPSITGGGKATRSM